VVARRTEAAPFESAQLSDANQRTCTISMICQRCEPSKDSRFASGSRWLRAWWTGVLRLLLVAGRKCGRAQMAPYPISKWLYGCLPQCP